MGYIDKVERVQRRATRIIPKLRDLPYEERLKKLNLYSLAYRRRRGDMIQVYKIYEGIDRIDKDKFFTSPTLASTRGHASKMHKERCRLKVRENVFGQRIVNAWNSLPDMVVQSGSLNQFKARLDRHWVGERFSQARDLKVK